MRKFLILLVGLLVMIAPIAAQDDMMMSGPDVIVTLSATPLAENAGLQGVTGWAHFVSDTGHVRIHLELNGATLPEGTVLEGWVVDAGLNGGPGGAEASNAYTDDEAFGAGFGNQDFIDAVHAAPYALSTGGLTEIEPGVLEVVYDIPNYYLAPYDAVVITAESDGNALEGFDPRPGTPVLSGLVSEGEPAEPMGDDMGMDDEMATEEAMMDDEMATEEAMMDDEMATEEAMMDDDMMMSEPVEITLETTPLAEGAGLEGVTATALMWVDNATIEITVNLNGATLPEGSVLEGWVVDAGLNGGPGGAEATSVSDADEAFGPPFGDANFDALVESAPYALSTGNLADDMGVLTLSFHLAGYNFSPYDAVVITLESDGNTAEGFDPRPGTPVLSGAIPMMGM